MHCRTDLLPYLIDCSGATTLRIPQQRQERCREAKKPVILLRADRDALRRVSSEQT